MVGFISVRLRSDFRIRATMSDDDKKIGWMYEGTKAIVNREDYLLGKKIDKNFELYSDVFVKDKEEDRLKALEERSKSCNDDAGPSRVSHLQVDVVRSEDPLVALKMRQAQRQRELMDNPLNKVKFQRMMKEIFSDGKKKSKKHKKNKKKLRSSDSDSSEDERKKQKKRRNDLDEEKSPKRSERRRNDSRSPVRRARRGSPSLQPKSKRDDSGDRMRKRLKASPQRGDRRIEKRRGSSPECRRRRHDSDRSMDSDRRRDSYSIRSFQSCRQGVRAAALSR
ncbi:hypothetical protein L596_018613 [Steinernema carpocapsae]|uniref:Uncharacterized protein n=1 Tax=Steinernema carpocapsae TaxID=34508 RepID=A0A4U5N5M7_STECR|nr:hypothetical protein L596_018613 [Steinernema carpocapsae]